MLSASGFVICKIHLQLGVLAVSSCMWPMAGGAGERKVLLFLFQQWFMMVVSLPR